MAGAGSSELGLRTTVAITFTRLFLIPPMGMSVVLMADKFGFLPPGNKMFKFVLLLQHSMPSSILAGKTSWLLFPFVKHDVLKEVRAELTRQRGNQQ
jgi:hypothetical protein